MERLNLRQLHQQRRKQYWISMAPYLRYVGGSLPGFILVVGFCLYGYGYFVNHLPDRFPIFVLMAILLAIPINSGSIRTYLREADVVFLLPMESNMPAYLNPCLRAGFISYGMIMTIVWFILWPSFQAAGESGEQLMFDYALIWIQLMLMQLIVMYGVWQEDQMKESRLRQFYKWIRLLIIGFLIYLVLTQSIAWSLIFIGLIGVGYFYALRQTTRYTIHWERLIMLEHKRRSRWITFFNLFIEVPREHSVVRQTTWLHQVAGMIAFQKSNAYRYLYVLTWIRSELFGIVTRLTIVGALLMVMMNSMWIKIGILLLFTYIIRLQLTELGRYHMNVETSSVYPVQKDQRATSARFITIRILLAVLVVLIVSFFISLLL